MNISILLGIIIGLIFAYIAYWLLNRGKKSDDVSSILDQKIPLIASTVKQQLEAEKQDIQTDLKNKKEAIEDLVKRVFDRLEDHQKKLTEAEKERVGSFRALKQELESQGKITEQLSVTTDGLKRVLSNNQLRGQFGEQVAEDLLKMSGFVRGVDYEANKKQKDSETRPDFTIFLPDGSKINVDAKFPFNNLVRSIETEQATEKKEYMKAFERDVREKIKQVSSRDYINPDDNTVDFVVLFIPNEMIFSYIYDKMHEVWIEAMKQKVVFAGPFSFTAILRLVRQSYDNFKYQKNVQKIITAIKNFYNEFEKYNEEFVKIGDRIGSLTQQYDKVNITRTKQLMRTIDRIRLEETSAETPLLDSDFSEEKAA